jgi:hypothetical protein
VRLLLVAAVGLLLPGGLFLYWLFFYATSLLDALSDKFAMAFVVDVVGTTFLLAYFFARYPPGPVKWPWFLVLSFGGTLWFGLAVYLWLNWRRPAEPGPPTTPGDTPPNPALQPTATP